MFIGEAPGRKEDETGRPFVGNAGKLLTLLLKNIGLERENVYITNIVKCRPPGNRDPKDDEVSACLPYLLRQIKLIQPRIIVTLGRHAGKTIYSLAGRRWPGIGSAHGKFFEGRIAGVDLIIFSTYHPAAALYKPEVRRILEDDFKILESIIAKPSKRKSLLDFF
jgi:DNA polymerase